ncbi:thioredoxin domain-containing protein [Paenibacillus sp. MMS20-IR301]|uniref:DsbA family protein n=1 Tax=Paenibacillus sp. MMS20-IR301 TaxID=2895946 RepID=UPI0028E82E40|nr:thioredoxin domain-containing protein [Paenibacillus sp. MMS20-IR301]WNS45069.1 thioredoxin domain-containing protein [Paenibacillus sp. MMS20-IR301]
MSKQEKRRAEQEQQKQKTRILIVSTVALVVIIFAGLFLLASKDSSTTASNADPVNFNYSEMARLGKEDAPVKIVEFGDYKCPACAQFTGVIKPQLVQEYVNQDKAAFYFVNLAFVGDDSRTASLAALSVYHQDQEAFWKFFDAVYANQGDENEEWATTDYLVSLAKQLELPVDYDLMRKDIEDQTYSAELERDIELGRSSGVTTTPSIFINGVKVAEPFNIEAIDAQIQLAAEAGTAQ